jgi:hypothetical protein
LISSRRIAVVVMATLAMIAMRPRMGDAAPDHAPRLVFEVHVGERTAKVGTLLDMLAESLETQGFAARGPTIRRMLGGRAPELGTVDRGKTAADIAAAVDGGVHAYVSARFEEAVTTLDDAIRQIDRNPGVLVIDTRNADMITRAYMTRALALARLGRAADSDATMTELIRITRGQPLSRADYGPDADKLYRAVLKQVQAAARGSLTITTGDERAMIFVDGSLRGVGKATLGDLIPGPYRVFVQVPGTTGRRYAIDVTAGQDHYLAVKSQLEEALWITDTWMGFRFEHEEARARAVQYASELARMWTGEGMVVVIGASEIEGKEVVAAALYRTDGSVVRRASVETDGADRDRLRSLARFIADGTPSDGLAIESRQRVERPAVAVSDGSSVAPKLVVLGGILGIAAGVTLYALDEDPDPTGPQRPQYRDTATAGVVVGAIGLAAAGIGAWWWIRTRPETESSHPEISLTRTNVSLGWTATF